MIAYQHIFDQTETKKPLSKQKLTTIDKNSQKQIDMLNYTNKQNGNSIKYSEDFEFCNIEINKTLAKKSWNSLDICFKWKYIESYLSSYDWILPQHIEDIKKLFLSKQLVVKFNNKERRIETLNHTIGLETI
jgi:hypothetical protein